MNVLLQERFRKRWGEGRKKVHFIKDFFDSDVVWALFL